jgi:hypothetical protein
MTKIAVGELIEQVAARLAAENNISESQAREILTVVDGVLAADAAEVERAREARLA